MYSTLQFSKDVSPRHNVWVGSPTWSIPVASSRTQLGLQLSTWQQNPERGSCIYIPYITTVASTKSHKRG